MTNAEQQRRVQLVTGICALVAKYGRGLDGAQRAAITRTATANNAQDITAALPNLWVNPDSHTGALYLALIHAADYVQNGDYPETVAMDAAHKANFVGVPAGEIVALLSAHAPAAGAHK